MAEQDREFSIAELERGIAEAEAAIRQMPGDSLAYAPRGNFELLRDLARALKGSIENARSAPASDWMKVAAEEIGKYIHNVCLVSQGLDAGSTFYVPHLLAIIARHAPASDAIRRAAIDLLEHIANVTYRDAAGLRLNDLHPRVANLLAVLSAVGVVKGK